MAIIEFVFFFLASAVALTWFAGRVLGSKFSGPDAPLQRPASLVVLAISLAFAYFMTFAPPLQIEECSHGGPAIYGSC